MIKKNKKYSYLGAIHIHSKFSDGTGDVEVISKAAKKAGLDWVVITDHNSFEIAEGFYNGVCVIKGEEISPKGANHYLALGINNLIEENQDVQKNINNVRNNGGFGFCAHPNETLIKNNHKRKNKWPAINWSDEKNIPDGVEIWNWFSQWGDNINDKNIFTLAYAYLFKHRLVDKPSKKTLIWWDKLNSQSEKIIPAIGGVDAHAIKVYDYLIPVTLFPYQEMFKTINNMIYLQEPLKNDFLSRKEQILTAIKKGNNLILNRYISKNPPEIYVENQCVRAYCGDSIELDIDTHLVIKTKEKYKIRVFLNGEEQKNITTKNLDFVIKKCGKYRVELELKENGYAYTNPIIVI